MRLPGKSIPNSHGYRATKDGQIWDCRKLNKMRSLRVSFSQGGFPSVRVNGTERFVHRLVARTWVENPDQLGKVEFVDGDRTNCHKDNLQWVRMQGGYKGKRLKLTEDQIEAIKIQLELGVKQKEIAQHFGVSPSHISKINCGYTHKR